MPLYDENSVAAKGGGATPASNHLQRDRAEEIALADIHAAMTQDRVGGGAMKIEVRQHEVVEIIVALHLALVASAERKRDLAIGRRVDLLAVERLEKGDCFRDTFLELRDRRLVVFVARRLNAGEARRTTPRPIRRDLDLTGEIEMSGDRRECSSTAGSIFFAVAKASALSRMADSALRLISKTGSAAWDIANGMAVPLGWRNDDGRDIGVRSTPFFERLCPAMTI
jgi:hypothetical protein